MKSLIKYLKPFFAAILIISASIGFSQEDDQNKRIIRLQVYTQNSFDQGSTSSDAIRIEFTDDGYNGIDNRDVVKMNNLDENLARLHGGTFLTVENRAQPEDGETLALYIDQYTTTNYTFKFDNENFQEFDVILKDNYLNTTMVVSEDNFLYSFTVNSAINASVAFNRFSLLLDEQTFSTNSFDQKPSFSILPNPVTQNFIQLESSTFLNEKVNIQIFNQVGKLIYQKSSVFSPSGSLSINNLNLNSGVYLIKLQSGSKQVTKKMIKQ